MQNSKIEYIKNIDEKVEFNLLFSLRTDQFKKEGENLLRVLCFRGVLPESQIDVVKMISDDPTNVSVNGEEYKNKKSILLVEDGEYSRTVNLEIRIPINTNNTKELTF